MTTENFDRFDKSADSPVSPARTAFAIVPSDTVALALLPKAILVGTAGTIVLRAVDSTADVAVKAQAGQILPIRAQFVRATGTDAADIVGLG